MQRTYAPVYVENVVVHRDPRATSETPAKAVRPRDLHVSGLNSLLEHTSTSPHCVRRRVGRPGGSSHRDLRPRA